MSIKVFISLLMKRCPFYDEYISISPQVHNAIHGLLSNRDENIE
jgi:hypothetical protein